MPGQQDVIDFAALEAVDARVGVVRNVSLGEGCRVPAYKLEIDLGLEICTPKSVAQATNYEAGKLVGKRILGVVNLPPRQVGLYRAEVLTLGVPTEERGTALVVPDTAAVVGGRLF